MDVFASKRCARSQMSTAQRPVFDPTGFVERRGLAGDSEFHSESLTFGAETSDGLFLAVALVLFALLWLALLSWMALSPPTDNIEQLTWVRSLEWGYFKHPPLPTWLFWLPVHWFGATALTSYATGAACVLGSMALMCVLVRQVRGARFATIAVLAALCITYYNNRLYYYNHNVVLMLVSTAAAVVYWQAHRTGRTVWWAGLGVVMGLGALTKYQIAVTAVCIAVFWLQQRGWKSLPHRRGLLLSILIALLIFSPHLFWLQTHNFEPVDYATRSSLGVHLSLPSRILQSAHWILDQVMNRALPAWLMLSMVALHQRRKSTFSATTGATKGAAGGMTIAVFPDDSSEIFLRIWGLVPLVFVVALGLCEGTPLQLHWSTPFLLFAVPVVMDCFRSRVAWSSVSLNSLALCFLVLQVLMLAQDAVTAPHSWQKLQDHHWRAFDSAALAHVVEGPARAELGRPICLVSGPAALAGVLALRLPDHPKVLIDGRADISPWVSRIDIERCGILRVRENPPSLGWSSAGADFPNLSWQVEKPTHRSESVASQSD